MNDWSDGWPAVPSQRNWDEIYWGSPDRGLTPSLPSLSIAGMARAEVVEFTTDFLGGDSSSIQQVWYNQNTLRMTVQFIQGGIYSYDGVSHALFKEFSESDSLGVFFRTTFRRPVPEKPWPGARHDEGRVTFKRVPVEAEKPTADLDVLKAAKLTTGKGETYTVHFSYESTGDMPVRAESPERAIEMFEGFMREHGFTAEVTRITMDVKRKK